MLPCRSCGSDLSTNHLLESTMWASIKKCGKRINVRDVLSGISRESKIILISGTAGKGKTAIGQYVERAYGYILIDGDADGNYSSCNMYRYIHEKHRGND